MCGGNTNKMSDKETLNNSTGGVLAVNMSYKESDYYLKPSKKYTGH